MNEKLIHNDAQSDTLHERSKSRNDLIKQKQGNNRETVTEQNSENSSTQNDEDVSSCFLINQKLSEIGSLKGGDKEEFKNSQTQVEVFLDSLSVELNFMMHGNQNLSREIIYQRLESCIDNLYVSQSIESITQSKLGNKLSAIYHQLIRVNDTSSQIVSISIQILQSQIQPSSINIQRVTQISHSPN